MNKYSFETTLPLVKWAIIKDVVRLLCTYASALSYVHRLKGSLFVLIVTS
jgi:hypothetical protein